MYIIRIGPYIVDDSLIFSKFSINLKKSNNINMLLEIIKNREYKCNIEIVMLTGKEQVISEP